MKTTIQYNGDAIASLEPGKKATLHCALEIMATDIVVESDELKLQEKTVTPTGEDFTEYPEEGYDGFGQVTVAGDANLTAENIKKGVTIYGKTGTHEGESSGGGVAEIVSNYTSLYSSVITAEPSGEVTAVTTYEVIEESE